MLLSGSLAKKRVRPLPPGRDESSLTSARMVSVLGNRWEVMENAKQGIGDLGENLEKAFHDGSSGVKVAMTPIRVVCQNTLNLALNTAKRSWTARHTENVLLRVQDARETLQLASNYMVELGNRGEELARIDLSDHKVQEFINEFFPISEDLSDCQRKNNLRLQENLKARYYNAPDLEWVGKNGWRFINAVSDFATHADPLRKTKNYNENLFLRTAEGNPMIDKAYKMVLAAA